MPISWLDHKGKKILFIDMKGATDDELIAIVEEQKKIIDEVSKPVLLLNDFTDTYVSKEYMDKAKEYGKKQKPKIKKTALIGIVGMKKILVWAYIKFSSNDNTQMFDNIEEAKEYLVK
ncbi:MAG: hypothetical protein H7A25_07930 [Leptospiraceae bacterium]|nr:hypothetical protein [Leptospiraceae bacterium]